MVRDCQRLQGTGGVNTPLLILPGFGGSGPDHWQTHWQAADPTMQRFAPSSWNAPRLQDWISALDRAVAGMVQPCVLVAHSLACLLVAHWAQRPHAPVRGAFLVAPPDPASPEFPAEARSFVDLPGQALGFPAVVVASANDPYASMAYAEQQSQLWGAQCVDVGNKGHINAQSGCGAWPEGRAMLELFLQEMAA